MARGWESKSVEEQQSIASSDGPGPQHSAAELARASAQRALELQISRVKQQLAAAASDRHREMLQLALLDLQTKLQSL